MVRDDKERPTLIKSVELRDGPKAQIASRPTWSGFAVALSLTGLLVGCQRPPAIPEAAAPVAGLKLGVLLPATGSQSRLGDPILEVLPLITHTVNACGGVNQAPVSLIVEDEQTDPKAEARIMSRLATEAKVGAVIGAFSNDSLAIAALDVAAQHKVPIISPTNDSSILTDRAQKGEFQGFWARTIPSHTNQAIALAQLLQQRGIKTASTVVVNDQNHLHFEQAFTSAFEKLGGSILGKDTPARYSPQDAEFSNAAFAAFSPQGQIPEAVVGSLDTKSGNLLLQSAYAQGLTSGIQVFLTDAARSSRFVEAVGQDLMGYPLLQGAIGTAPSDKGPGHANFLKIWQAEQTQPPASYTAQAWDAAALVMLAAQAAGSNDGAAIRSKLQAVANPPGREITDICDALQHLREGEDINYQGASSKVDLDQNGDIVTPYDVWTIDAQGKIKSIGQITPTLK